MWNAEPYLNRLTKVVSMLNRAKKEVDVPLAIENLERRAVGGHSAACSVGATENAGSVFWRCAERAARSCGTWLLALSLRKPRAASRMAAAVQRSAMEASRQRLTLRQTRRTEPMMVSI
jgi:hypothetical protein